MRSIIVLSAFIALCSFPLLAQTAEEWPMATVPQTETTDSLKISFADNVIYLENAKAGSKMEIYSMLGEKVQVITVSSSTFEHRLHLPKGYYIIRIEKLVKKVVVR